MRLFDVIIHAGLSAVFIGLCLHIAYIPTRSGIVEVDAPHNASILREKSTGIEHIVADSLHDAIFAQGYAHA
jgi:acyl-homoserine lactone acylase PvdQ